MTLYQFNRRS